MDWYETLKTTAMVMLIFDIMLNWGWYRNRKSSDKAELVDGFKTIWHRRFNTMTTVVVTITAIAIIAHWIKALI
ncbi:hypothetical protein [Moraxella sp. ZY210820]|uniref:hypothetical protein n=1 Tax=unclassified Moraxella TaxID=2685852 RepID=UPI0027302E59|nr:hypothetical protein [Moraxella sp. ZY210820]WLF84700.1 hypothetical protein LU301_04285 [Moraxella sp. ZY210820]